jgi:hypothetical protein
MSTPGLRRLRLLQKGSCGLRLCVRQLTSHPLLRRAWIRAVAGSLIESAVTLVLVLPQIWRLPCPAWQFVRERIRMWERFTLPYFSHVLAVRIKTAVVAGAHHQQQTMLWRSRAGMPLCGPLMQTSRNGCNCLKPFLEEPEPFL